MHALIATRVFKTKTGVVLVCFDYSHFQTLLLFLSLRLQSSSQKFDPFLVLTTVLAITETIFDHYIGPAYKGRTFRAPHFTNPYIPFPMLL